MIGAKLGYRGRGNTLNVYIFFVIANQLPTITIRGYFSNDL